MERIYIVTETATNAKTPVQAKSRAQALAAVTAAKYSVKPATALDAAHLLATGAKLVHASAAQPEPKPEPAAVATPE